MAHLSPGSLAGLTAAGILREAELASAVVCDGCGDGCLEEVVFPDVDEGEEPRAYVVCGEHDYIGQVAIPLERLRTWALDTAGLAVYLASALQGGGHVEECVPGRLWWLGRPVVRGRRIDAFLARGGAWGDAGETFGTAGRLRECVRPLVMVPWDVSTGEPFGTGVQVLSLARSFSLSDDTLQLDLRLIEEATEQEPPAAERTRTPRLVIEGIAAEYDGKPLILGELPLKLLTHLAAAKGQPLAQGDLAVFLWGEGG